MMAVKQGIALEKLSHKLKNLESHRQKLVLKGGVSLFPHPMVAVDKGLNRLAGNLPLFSWIEWRLLTIDTLKPLV